MRYNKKRRHQATKVQKVTISVHRTLASRISCCSFAHKKKNTTAKDPVFPGEKRRAESAAKRK